MKKSYRVLGLFILLAGTVFFGAGCSDRKAPDVSSVHPELLLDLYASAEKDDYGAALRKIERLKALDPASVFLAEAETLEKSNILLMDVNAKIAKKDFKGAAKQIELYEKRYGADRTTEDVKSAIAILTDLRAAFADLREASDSLAFSSALERVENLAKKAGIREKNGNFFMKKRSRLEKLRSVEKDWIVFSLCSDAVSLFPPDAPESGVLLALLKLENGAKALSGETETRLSKKYHVSESFIRKEK